MNGALTALITMTGTIEGYRLVSLLVIIIVIESKQAMPAKLSVSEFVIAGPSDRIGRSALHPGLALMYHTIILRRINLKINIVASYRQPEWLMDISLKFRQATTYSLAIV